MAAQALVLVSGAVSAAAADVEATVTALIHEGARVQCALFASADGFPRAEEAIARTVARVAAGRAVCLFASVPAGSYALAAFEDRNGNGSLDVNLFGAPVEGIAFSRDARGRLGPPGFEAARFVHGTEPTRLRLRATY
jgi:uncharacterized protein (DUF2141 family)